jgi:molybdopterin adenylyltransferase
LSRSVSGTRGRSLIVNLPGSPGGAKGSLEAVISIIPHALTLLEGSSTQHDEQEGTALELHGLQPE